jgi:hypothetical protein
MANSSGNVSNIVGLGGVDTSSNLTIPEANSQGYFSLNASGLAVSVGNVSPFYKNGVLYQVTSGKTCVVVHVIFTSADSSGNSMQLMHSLTTFATNATTASLTSPVYQGGGAGNYVYFNTAAYVPTSAATMYNFPSVSYPGYQNGATGSSVILICKEM